MYNIIKNATLEFEKNGRSDAFMEMENKIIRVGKPIQIYFFARYAKGADVNRLLKVMMKKDAKVEELFAFIYYVKGVEKDLDGNVKVVYPYIRPFLKKFVQLKKVQEREVEKVDVVLQGAIGLNHRLALSQGKQDADIDPYLKNLQIQKDILFKDLEQTEFWIERVVKFAKEQNRLDEITDLIEIANIDVEKIRTGKEVFDIDDLIEKAEKELAQNGRSQKFISIENEMKYNALIGDFRATVFIKNLLDYIDKKAFQTNILLSGDYFHIFLFGKDVEGASKRTIFTALQLAKLDYIQIEKELAKIKNTGKRNGKRKNLLDEMYDNADIEYILEVNNCIATFKYILNEEKKMF